jgi:hypothetical protein
MIYNNCIFPYYGYSIEIMWIYYGFSDAIANVIVWISHFSSVTMSILVTFSLKQVHACTRRASLTTVQFIMLYRPT